MPRVGKVHKSIHSKGGQRLYNIGGKRGLNLVMFFANGVPLVKLGIFLVVSLFWALPLSLFVSPTWASGIGSAVLFGVPFAVAALSDKAFGEDGVSVKDYVQSYASYYLAQNRHYAGNTTFVPRTGVPIRARVFMPRPLDVPELIPEHH